MTKRPVRCSLLALSLLGLGLLLPGPAEGRLPDALFRRPPRARVVPHVREKHGERFVDPFFWLRQRDNPEVIRYLKAENAYTRHFMRDTEPLQETLYQEMLARIKETDFSVPRRHGPFLYYERTEQGKQHLIHCRRRDQAGAPEEILLDENALAVGRSCFDLGTFEVSPDHRLLAFSVDDKGGETYTLQVKDLATGRLFPEAIPNTSPGVAWANDNRTIFYAVLNESLRPWRVYRHVLGDDPARDVLIHEETDDRFNVGVTTTKDRRFLLITSDSNTTSEVRVLDADRPAGEFMVLIPRREEVQYAVEHHGSSFFVVTNADALDFKVLEGSDRLVAAPSAAASAPAVAAIAWREFIPHTPGVKIDDLEVFADWLVVQERRGGLPRLRYCDAATRTFREITFDEPAYSLWIKGNEEFDLPYLRFHFSSLVTPETVYDFHFPESRLELRKRKEVLGGYDPSTWQVERLAATASDGTRIPISLVYRKGLVRDGSAPMYLTGYGAYGSNSDPYFSSNRLSLLQRGFVYAVAHIRGGDEMGRQWYLDGKRRHKMHSFTDFIACAEFLIREGYTSPGRLAISGASAGGLLMGAVTNLRPDLWGAVVADVPFVDAISTMLDPSLPLTVEEYEEWGNPEHPEDYASIRAWSPYDNLAARAYPPMLVIAGLNDARVMYWEPAKYVARLRTLKTDANPLLLKTNMGQGHAGASGRYDFLREIAFEYAFILKVLGLLPPSSATPPAP
ncbi:MAG: Protease II [Candidatus Ozemobacter sibiricus]|uniref:Protease II n=1 Tax=Candidatus Ozemobacter sibiricus TaxID=2268124 RepID=A0A367ZVN7_9BACT|nr:MAG: Protease II [Candidatus Ozemobacter sibiricus]